MPAKLPGLVIRAQSGFFIVATDQGEITCNLRGRLKRGPRTGDVIAMGDRVEISSDDGKTGMVEAILPRHRMFSRLDPRPQGEYQQILIANPDQVVLVFACAEPQPKMAMLDRFLVIAERAGIPPLIVANKIDLVGGSTHARELFRTYRELGYPVVFTSTRSGEGVVEIKSMILNKITLFTGPSGVGKSSLLNAIQPGLGLAAREVSQSTSKGKHTTVVRELFRLQEGGWVADTPGLKALALWDIEPEELDAYFPEIGALVSDCQFNDCTHLHEPGCAVLLAATQGRIDPNRYQSYLRMRFGEELGEAG
jgi:ribosome biogenesis GTPase / thiamine phosphate phosphatase